MRFLLLFRVNYTYLPLKYLDYQLLSPFPHYKHLPSEFITFTAFPLYKGFEWKMMRQINCLSCTWPNFPCIWPRGRRGTEGRHKRRKRGSGGQHTKSEEERQRRRKQWEKLSAVEKRGTALQRETKRKARVGAEGRGCSGKREREATVGEESR